MNFVVYCCIIQHIYMLWDVIIMFCIHLGYLSNNPFSSGFNSLWQKTLFLAFLTFQELRDSKKGKFREHGLEILRRTSWTKVFHKHVNRLKMRTCGVVSHPGHATCTHLCLEHLMSSFFAWFSLSWPKTNYLKGPLGILKRRWWRNTKNTKQGLLPDTSILHHYFIS
jgi:hypothetical protein